MIAGISGIYLEISKSNLIFQIADGLYFSNTSLLAKVSKLDVCKLPFPESLDTSKTHTVISR